MRSRIYGRLRVLAPASMRPAGRRVRATARPLSRRVRTIAERLMGFRVRTKLKQVFWWSVRAWYRVTFRNHRLNALALWPDARGLDLWCVTGGLALLRFHDEALGVVCRHAHHIRRLRRPRRPSESGPRRVLHVTCSFDLGGTQTQVRNLCLQPEGSFSHDAIETFPEMNYLYRQNVRIDAARYVTGNVLSRAVGRMTVYASTRSAQLLQMYKLVKDFRALEPDIVVGWGHEMSMITFVAAAIARVPSIVFCIRTFNPTAYPWAPERMQLLLRTSHRRMQPLVAALIVNSHPLQTDHAEWLGIDPDRVSVCPNGIDRPATDPVQSRLHRQRIRRQFGIPADALVLLNVGRFSDEKGQMSLARANADLLRRFSNRPFYWVLCGDGPTLPAVQRYAADQAMTNIVFAGRTDDVGAFLCAADVFVMPSDFEGMPNAMMEAMTQGLPCISTNRSGALDIARDGCEALYYAPGDTDRLVDHLMHMMLHDDVRERFGRMARERMNEFSVAHSVQVFERILETVH